MAYEIATLDTLKRIATALEQLVELQKSTTPAATFEPETLYDVVLVNAGEYPIRVMALVRELTGRTLMDAKAFVRGVEMGNPQLVESGLSERVARSYVQRFDERDATAVLQVTA